MKPFPKAEKVTEVTASTYKNVRAVAPVRVHRREAVVLHRLDDRFRSDFLDVDTSPRLPLPTLPLPCREHISRVPSVW